MNRRYKLSYLKSVKIFLALADMDEALVTRDRIFTPRGRCSAA